MRYEVVNIKKLNLSSYFQGSTQITVFYVPEFQNIVKDFCPEYIFCNEYQLKMDDDYPSYLFEVKMCSFLLKQAINNLNGENGKGAFKWLMFCLIGGALEIVLNGDEELPEENQFQFQMLGFFLMNKVQQNTIPIPKLNRIFTPSTMREYLNLFITLFREYLNDSCEQALISKMGSTHLEHFFALLRKYCYFDHHLISIAHAFERIVALRVIRESDEMRRFSNVNRRQIQKSICKNKFKWNWSTASKMFILADDIFEAVMRIDSKDYILQLSLLNDISCVITGNKINRFVQKFNPKND